MLEVQRLAFIVNYFLSSAAVTFLPATIVISGGWDRGRVTEVEMLRCSTLFEVW